MASDMFGNPSADAPTVPTGTRKYTPNGYAAQPGTGPAGETCKSCRHFDRSHSGSSKTFLKCKLIRHRWTNSYGTDVLAGSPACRKWEAPAGGPREGQGAR